MKPETLHALLLDRTLGELPAPTAELLEAYLATAPTTAAEAQRLATTATLARAAVAVDADSAVAPAIRPWHLHVAQRLFAHHELWRLAACLVLGGLIGWGAARSVALRDFGLAPLRPIAAPAPVRPAAAPTRPSVTFWRPTSLARSDPRPRTEVPRYRLRWDPSRPAPTLEETP